VDPELVPVVLQRPGKGEIIGSLLRIFLPRAAEDLIAALLEFIQNPPGQPGVVQGQKEGIHHLRPPLVGSGPQGFSGQQK
jgi:hypothetical protein